MRQIIQLILLSYTLIILGVVILSWFPLQPGSPGHNIFMALRRLTEPVLGPVRRAIPPIGGGAIDISPMIVLFVLMALRAVLA